MNELEIKHEKYKQKSKKWFIKLFITSITLIILGILLMIIFATTTTSISHTASKIILYFGLSLIFIGFIPWGINGYLETRELYYFMKLKKQKKLETKNISTK